jgi:hypothetical protein
MEKKREGDREAAGEVFLSSDPLYHYFFGIGNGKGELLKLLLGRQHRPVRLGHYLTSQLKYDSKTEAQM